MSFRLYFLQICKIFVRFAGVPPKWTGKIQTVFEEIESSISSGSIHSVFGSISTKIGFPPFFKIQFAVDTKDNEGSITSFPLISIRDSAMFSADVPLLTARQDFEFIYIQSK